MKVERKLEEEFTLHVKVKRGKIVSQILGKGTSCSKGSPSKRLLQALKEKPKALLDEDVPKKSVDPSKSKPSFVTTSQTTEGPGGEVGLGLPGLMRCRNCQPEGKTLQQLLPQHE
ncbi:hypothetical protein HAX54_044152 [Datura stramonium]|uniref:Uncharacterized protein n=1 Tax=Datura stramonium TaxID=4076 RepID=A0ABS8RP18_DATST|nr:hypothetical protein [Datura stramonium]